MWIKICANTNVEDARLAAELGADAVGFVFAPSKRQVTARQVAAIVSHLPDSVEKTGVFATREADEVVRIVRATGLTGVQLHGGFDIDLARGLRSELDPGVTITQTLHRTLDGDGTHALEFAAQLKAVGAETAIDRVLIDSKKGDALGGSGTIFDWSASRETLLNCGIKVIVAGGLRPENLCDAIAALDPWGVDVASGVEAVPGRKDPEKMRRFIQNARKGTSTPAPPSR